VQRLNMLQRHFVVSGVLRIAAGDAMSMAAFAQLGFPWSEPVLASVADVLRTRRLAARAKGGPTFHITCREYLLI